MGWVRDALRELKAGRPATVQVSAVPLRGRIEGGQAVTLSPVDSARVVVDDVVLVRWKSNPILLLVKDANEGQLAVGDTLGATYGWVDRVSVLGKVTEVRELPEGHVPKQKPRTVTFGIDTPGDYDPKRVLGALGVPSLEGDQTPVAEAAQVIFLPSFHPECCITVTLGGASPQVVLTTMQTNLWYWWCHQMQQARGTLGPGEPTPDSPDRWCETAPIPTDRLAFVRGELHAADALDLADTDAIGIDGMCVHGEYRSPEGKVNHFEDRPDPSHPRHYQFVMTIYRIANELLRDQRSVRLLESLHAYLDDALPLKVTDGPPLALRLFGRLSSSDASALGAALASVAPDRPVLMDLSNFEGMGTLLYPIFQQFVRDRARTATVWWATGHARQQVEAMGVPPSAIFAEREMAVASLA